MATFTLSSPLLITSRLMAGLRVGNGFISIEYSEREGNGGRTRYHYFIDFEGKEFEGDDLQSGCGEHGLQVGLESLLCFLDASAESYAYAMRRNCRLEDTENGELFHKEVVEWAYQYKEELQMLAFELQDNPKLIKETK